MSDDLIKRMRKRAKDDRQIQANNEVVASALRGQRLLFDQGVHSEANTFAVRLALDYERFAKNDAALAKDWDEAADRIEQLERENARLDAGWHDANFRALDAGLKLAKAVAGLKPLVQICEMMRDSSGFRKGRYQHEVTDSQWSAWCKQIKTTRAVLAELEGGE